MSVLREDACVHTVCQEAAQLQRVALRRAIDRSIDTRETPPLLRDTRARPRMHARTHARTQRKTEERARDEWQIAPESNLREKETAVSVRVSS